MSRIVRRFLAAALLCSTVSVVAIADVASASPAPTATGPVYTVRAGDTLIRIAQRSGSRLADVLSLNNITATSLIVPGMRLRLPAGATLPVARPASTPTTTAAVPAAKPARTYTVLPGDSLIRIASRHAVRLADLLSLNDITASSLILPGRVLQLPAAAVAPATNPTTTTTTIAPTTVPTPSPAVPTTGDAQLDVVLRFAEAQVGKPYKFFTAGPDTYDCSGLTRAAYLQADVSLPHQSTAQSELGTAVDWTTSPILPGDLVFLTRDGLESSPISHVGIATGASTWVHATRPGDVVRTGTIPVWRVVEVRRFLGV